jgi:Ca-activated chloride channel family protein
MLAPMLAGEPQPRERVAVVAIHDSRLLTLCPVIGKDVVVSDVAVSGMGPKATVGRAFAGFQKIELLGGQRIGAILPLPAQVQESAASVPGIQPPAALERLAIDAEVRRVVEAQFRKRGRYSIVDSPAEADLVFLVESYYLPMALGAARFPTRPRPPEIPLPVQPTPERIFSAAENEWARRQWDYDKQPKPPLPPESPGPVFRFGVLVPDEWAPGWRQASVAIVVPAAVYRSQAGRGEELSSARLWQGLSTAPVPTERPRGPGEGPPQTLTTWGASPEELVDQFHRRGFKLPDFLPVCGATAGAIAELAVEGSPTVQGSADSRATGDAMAVRASPAAHFRSNSTLVTVPVTLAGRDGRAVDDVGPAEFHVFEDGVEQRIDSVTRGTEPADVAFLVDTSSSMRGAVEQVRTAAKAMVNEIRPSDRAAVVAFDSRILVRSAFTTDRGRLDAALGQLRTAGGTRLFDALALTAIDVLDINAARNSIVVLTDGLDTESRLADGAGALAAVGASNVEVHVMEFPFGGRSPMTPSVTIAGQTVRAAPAVRGDGPARPDPDPRFLDRLVTQTGGTMHRVESSDDLHAALAELARGLSHQYLLRYYSSNPKLDGRYRNLRVTVERPVDIVRVRKGYLAAVLVVGR